MSDRRNYIKYELLFKKIQRFLRMDNLGELKRLLRGKRPEDIASFMTRFNDSEKLKIFDLLAITMAGIVLKETDPVSKKVLLDNVNDQKLATVLSSLSDDEATDLLSMLDEERSQQILGRVKDSDSIELLLSYPPETAGGIMSTEFIAVRNTFTVKTTLASIRKYKSEDPDIYHIIYVVDEHGHLLGYVTLARLLKVEPNRRLNRIYRKDPIRVQPSVDQEEVAHLVSLYNLINIPVVDESNKLVGVVYVDDVIDVITDEATEDFYKMAGVREEEQNDRSLLAHARIRLPWLFITLVGSLMTSLVINSFQPTLNQVLALAAFMPLIAAMSGNVGVQSSSIVIRGLATGRIPIANIWYVLFREFRVGATIGLVCGLMVGFIVHFWEADVSILDVGLVVGIAMFSAMTVAATIGSFIPFFLQKLNIDPAIATGPFVTTINDITGLSIYFLTANALLA